jgi:hypothetical protein
MGDKNIQVTFDRGAESALVHVPISWKVGLLVNGKRGSHVGNYCQVCKGLLCSLMQVQATSAYIQVATVNRHCAHAKDVNIFISNTANN